jgi:hypothetical protein
MFRHSLDYRYRDYRQFFLSLSFERGALPASIELIPDGAEIWGRDGRMWNGQGGGNKRYSTKGEYGFISPVFLHDDEGEITVVLRAAFTNSPNLQLPAINAERSE